MSFRPLWYATSKVTDGCDTDNVKSGGYTLYRTKKKKKTGSSMLNLSPPKKGGIRYRRHDTYVDTYKNYGSLRML